MTKFILISLLTTAALSAPVQPATEAAPFGPPAAVDPVHPQEVPHLALPELRGSVEEKDASNPFNFDEQTHRMIQGKRRPSNITLPDTAEMAPSNLVRVSKIREVPVKQVENLVRVLDIIELAIDESYLLSSTLNAKYLDQEPLVELVSKYISPIRELLVYREVEGTEFDIPFALEQIQMFSTRYVEKVLKPFHGLGKKKVFEEDQEVITNAVAMLKRVTGLKGTWEFDEEELAALSGVSRLFTASVFALMMGTTAVLMN
jgi:hypothetical protein